MEIMQYNNDAFLARLRPFDEQSMTELALAVRKHPVAMYWGCSDWTRINDYILRFAVGDYPEVNLVHLVVNASDLFDVYITDRHRNMLEKSYSVYVGDLVRIIDEKLSIISERVAPRRRRAG